MSSINNNSARYRVFAVTELREKIFDSVFHVYEGDPERHLNHGRDLIAFWYFRLVSRQFKSWVEDIFQSAHIKHTQILLDFGRYMVEGRHPDEIPEDVTPQSLEANGEFNYKIDPWKFSSSDESDQENYFHNKYDYTDDSYRPKDRLEVYFKFARWGTTMARSKYTTSSTRTPKSLVGRYQEVPRKVAIFSFNGSPDTFVMSSKNRQNKKHRYYKLCQEKWRKARTTTSVHDSALVSSVWTAGVQVWNMYQDMELPIAFMNKNKMEFAVEWSALFALFFEKERSLRYLRVEKVRY
jgi:hypothetical protein